MNVVWKRATEEAGIKTIDLYQKYPNWKIDIEQEQELLLRHQRIVLQFPFYWYSCPPMLKKWLDDVWAYNWAYGPGGDNLKNKELLIAISCGGPEAAYRAGGYNNFSINEFLKPFQQTANLVGMKYLPYFVFNGARSAPVETIKKSAADYIAHITSSEFQYAKPRR